MVSEQARTALQAQMAATIESFGLEEGNAILRETMERMADGGGVSDWLSTIDAVILERHPYMQFLEERPN